MIIPFGSFQNETFFCGCFMIFHWMNWTWNSLSIWNADERCARWALLDFALRATRTPLLEALVVGRKQQRRVGVEREGIRIEDLNIQSTRQKLIMTNWLSTKTTSWCESQCHPPSEIRPYQLVTNHHCPLRSIIVSELTLRWKMHHPAGGRVNLKGGSLCCHAVMRSHFLKFFFPKKTRPWNRKNKHEENSESISGVPYLGLLIDCVNSPAEQLNSRLWNQLNASESMYLTQKVAWMASSKWPLRRMSSCGREGGSILGRVRCLAKAKGDMKYQRVL